MDSQADGWLREHPKVEVTLPGRPEGDWRDEEGYGWIAKVWFRTWGDARTAKAAISSEGWTPGSLGRKIRVGIRDGRDGQRLAEFVLNGGRTSGASSFVATDARLGQHALAWRALPAGESERDIGVPRFELGTSPTRTERATRLRHTPKRPKQ